MVEAVITVVMALAGLILSVMGTVAFVGDHVDRAIYLELSGFVCLWLADRA